MREWLVKMQLIVSSIVDLEPSDYSVSMLWFCSRLGGPDDGNLSDVKMPPTPLLSKGNDRGHES